MKQFARKAAVLAVLAALVTVIGCKSAVKTSSAASVAATDVTLNKSTLSLVEGSSEMLTATNKNVTWESSKTDVATVDKGTVTAVNAGEATITVTTADGKKRQLAG